MKEIIEEIKNEISKETMVKIMTHLQSIDVIDSFKGENNDSNLIRDNIDYKTVDLKLPPELKKI